MQTRVALQPHLGRTSTNYKPQDNIPGYLALAKVIKIHHKYNTVDLQIIKTNNLISSSNDMEGKFGARICVSSAHFDSATSCSSGVIEPILEGQIVVLAFLDNKKSEPIVIGSFHNTWETSMSILPNQYPVTNEEDKYKYLRVYPAQGYHKVDGLGGVEMSLPCTSFFVSNSDVNNVINDDHLGFDHKDLSEKDPATGRTRIGREMESLESNKMLFVHRSRYSDEEVTWTKFFIDRGGEPRITRDNNDGTLSYWEMSRLGGMHFHRQNDSSERGGETQGSYIDVYEDGSINLERKIGDNSSHVKVEKDGAVKISVHGKSTITLNTDGTISLDTNNGILLSSGSSTLSMSQSSIAIKATKVSIDASNYTHSKCNCKECGCS